MTFNINYKKKGYIICNEGKQGRPQTINVQGGRVINIIYCTICKFKTYYTSVYNRPKIYKYVLILQAVWSTLHCNNIQILDGLTSSPAYPLHLIRFLPTTFERRSIIIVTLNVLLFTVLMFCFSHSSFVRTAQTCV